MVDKKIDEPKPAPRGRPRGFDCDDAIAIAKGLFHAKGYDAVGIAELGDAMHLKAPSLYAAFGNKAGLFEQALQDYAGTEGAALASAAFRESDPVRCVRALLAEAADAYSRDEAKLGCMVIETARGAADPEVRHIALRIQTLWRDDLVRRFAAAGDSAEALADYVVVAMTGLSGAARAGVGGDALAASAGILADGFALSFEAAVRPAGGADAA